MIGAIALIIILFLITQVIIKGFKSRHPWLSVKLMHNLYWYHTLFVLIYYTYSKFNASDSVMYFYRPQTNYATWFDAYKTGTPFIDFLGYPFINYFGFSYEMMMVLFAWLGYWGFVYFYLVFKENTRFRHKWNGMDLINVIIFLPNMHYWTSSLGKGPVIFLGLAMAMYALSRIDRRKLTLIVGLCIVYHVRPHVFLFMSVGILVGLITGQQKVPLYQKLIVIAGSATALFLMFDQIIAFAQLDSDNLVGSFDAFSSHRAVELAKAGSGLDISNYPLIYKLFTFWFRPLFFDAPGPIGIIVSFENLFYLFLVFKICNTRFLKFLFKGSALVKTSIVLFLVTSFALSGTLSNLGLIIRQKSQVMYFLLFVIVCFIDYKKSQQVAKKQKAMERQAAMKEVQVI